MTTAPLRKQHETVNGKQLAYHEVGTGDPVVFLHGTPTSSYLWRDIVPHVSGQARCVVPDLIGQGDSNKLDAVGTGQEREEFGPNWSGRRDPDEFGNPCGKPWSVSLPPWITSKTRSAKGQRPDGSTQCLPKQSFLVAIRLG